MSTNIKKSIKTGIIDYIIRHSYIMPKWQFELKFPYYENSNIINDNDIIVAIPITASTKKLHKLITNSKAKSINGRTYAIYSSKLDIILKEFGFTDLSVKLGIKAGTLNVKRIHTLYTMTQDNNLIDKMIANNTKTVKDIEKHKTLQRKTKEMKKIKFYSKIKNNYYNNNAAANIKHGRVFNIFSNLPKAIRIANLLELNNYQPVYEIDRKNSIIQYIASKMQCNTILQHIKNNTLMPNNETRDRIKTRLIIAIFTQYSDAKQESKTKNIRTLELHFKKLNVPDDEIARFVQYFQLFDNETLWDCENDFRDLANYEKSGIDCINVHDCVYLFKQSDFEKCKQILTNNNHLVSTEIHTV